MKVQEIRERFLQYFERHGHARVRSSSLIPERDPTLFFTNAGMVQFKNVFSGEEQREYTRATSVQKCMRVSGKHNDLENVGFTPRHHTFFEMLGNFSFGDYFKRDAIHYGWQFLTKEMGLDPQRLWATVYREDDEGFELWREIGLPEHRIGRCGKDDNYWSMGSVGPNGPCAEIHWDLGEDHPVDGEPDCWGQGHDAGRYMEIWNLVFMQYFTDAAGVTTPLPKPCVDTGMGLERLAVVMQGVPSNYDTDELSRIRARASEIAGVAVGHSADTDVSLRVLADHARATAFLLADGVLPSNVERGYVLRRVMRRAIRYGFKLGIEQPFLHELADETVRIMTPAYPELQQWRDKIVRFTRAEEETFRRTLDRGLHRLDEAMAPLPRGGGGTIPGEVVFELYATDGFPPDLTRIIATELGHGIDEAGYTALMEQHRDVSGGGKFSQAHDDRKFSGTTEYVGYERLELESEVLGLVDGSNQLESTSENETVGLITKRTPFYAESGGQVGDTGVVSADGFSATVSDTQQHGPVVLHTIQITSGGIRVGQRVHLVVDATHRDDIRRNHTATHLLHAALRETLGSHVSQQGSVVDAGRVRFDFSHFEALTDEQIREIEDRVNAQVRRNQAVVIEEMAYDDAVERGAMALFGEKYGDRVRVVQVPGTSTELCGGTHCARTGDIGLFKIASEGSVGTGVRRVEALTGRGTEAHVRAFEAQLDRIAELVRAQRAVVDTRVGKVVAECKALRKEVEELKERLASGGIGGGEATLEPIEVDGVALVTGEIEAEAKALRERADRLLEQLGSGIVVLGSREGGAARLVVKVSKDLTDRHHAGKIVAALAARIGGKGGGRPDMAQAGGKNAEALPAALASVADLIRSI